jgi:probable rRNA maturation factor
MTVEVEVNAAALAPGLDAAVVTRVVDHAVRRTLADRGVGGARVSVTLLDDGGMAALNRRWKGRDGATDVLAFPLFEAGELPVGDIYLGVERARAQGVEAGEPAVRELARLAIHGTLHVLGWDHPEDGREASDMWSHQERILGDMGLE